MYFQLTENQIKKYKEWKDHCDTYAGAIGGRHSFVFTPTGLGECVEVRCICGEKINLTEVDDW